IHAEAQETNGTAAEAQERVPPLSIPTRGSGDLSNQPGAARLGQLLRGRTLQRVLQLHPTLGRKEGSAPFDACPETQGLRLDAVEYAVVVRDLEAVQQLPGSSATAESRPSRIGPINLGMKQTGERSAGNPHAAFDVAGTGNVAWSRCCDTSQPKGRGNREHKLRPKTARQSPTLLLGGRWKRRHHSTPATRHRPTPPVRAPILPARRGRV